jgi:uncharacterized protein YdcH (DUF465 family)
LRNFSNLRAMRTVTLGRILSVTRKELSAVVAGCAARSERAEASIRQSRAGIEAARRRQEEAIARQQATIARHEALVTKHEEIDAEWKEMVRNSKHQTDEIVAELREPRTSAEPS